MTVKELIEALKKMPEDTRVVISGYEGGYNDVSELNEIRINPDVNTAWYYGKHEVDIFNEGVNCIDAVEIA